MATPLRHLPALLLLAACGGGDQETRADAAVERGQDASAAVSDASEPDTGESIDAATDLDAGSDPTPTFARIYDEILVPAGCTNGYCHGAGAGYLMLSDAETSYASLVSARAFNGACEVELRVAPNDAEASLLWRKIAPGIAVCEEKMPYGTEGLTADQAELVRRWIEAGAPR
jgi:hypothetical protein